MQQAHVRALVGAGAAVGWAKKGFFHFSFYSISFSIYIFSYFSL
jgi:hypothetical protein